LRLILTAWRHGRSPSLASSGINPFKSILERSWSRKARRVSANSAHEFEPLMSTIRSQPPLIPHFLLDRLALCGIEAAATISRAERCAPQSALTEKLTLRRAAQLAAVVALDRPPMILAESRCPAWGSDRGPESALV
jgi:hypothetical protein